MSFRSFSVAALSLLTIVAAAGSQAGPAGATSPPIVQISAGGTHTCAVVNQGSLKCWGSNYGGELGDGTYTHRSAPVDAAGLESGVLSVGAGEVHTCAVTVTGGAKCWGAGGNLGDGTASGSSTPVDVIGLTSGVAQVSAGFWHTCAVTTAGGVKCWGANSKGQLGDGTKTGRVAPVDTLATGSGAVAVAAAGRLFTCALMDQGSVQCWGDNSLGQLGDGTTDDSLAPVSVTGLGGTAVAISAGWWHTCVLLSSGGVQCWGVDTDLTFGDMIPGPLDFSPVPVDVPGLTSGVTEIAAGGVHSCALTDAAGVKCWGNNEYGQLGGNAVLPSSPVPVDVGGLETGATAISAGSGHTCVISQTEDMMCWGNNVEGELGSGEAGGLRTTPMHVVFSPEADSDLDGCSDGRETGPDARLGGRRDPKSFWDFFDTPPRDGAVTVGDILRLVGRFGASGDPAIDPLSTPPPTGYHTAFDRSAPAPGGDPWDLGPADGSISTNDLLFVLNQFGHTCT